MLTLIIFPLIGWGLFWLVGEKNWLEVFQFKTPLIVQILLGGFVGLLTAIAAWEIIGMPFMKPVLDQFGPTITQLRLNHFLIVFISFCAGFGEELLFRASLQPFLGLLLTSILFIALHGYLNPWNWRISIYGVYMTIVILTLGWMFEEFGIYSAAIAHMAIDWVLLYKLNQQFKGSFFYPPNKSFSLYVQETSIIENGEHTELPS